MRQDNWQPRNYDNGGGDFRSQYRPRDNWNRDNYGGGWGGQGQGQGQDNFRNGMEDECEEIGKNYEIPTQKIKEILMKYDKEANPYKQLLISNDCAREQILSKKVEGSGFNEWDKPETQKHMKYLMTYKIQKCPNPGMHKSTKERADCFYFHSNEDKRRVPMYVHKESGKFMAYFNYKPVICPTRDYCTNTSCIYSHNTKEIEYHPLVYKTELCKYRGVEDEFECDSMGEKCPFAHSIKDLRKLIKLLTEEGKPFDLNIVEGEKAVDVTIIDSKLLDSFEVGTYKTIKCTKKGCAGGIECLYYHENLFEKRRSISMYKYINKPCETVFYGKAFHDPQKCKKGDMCQFCHTKNELYYHPDSYKKQKCIRKPCKYGKMCPDFHEEEKIEVSRFIEEENSPPPQQEESDKHKNSQNVEKDAKYLEELEKYKEATQYFRCFKCGEIISDGNLRLIQKCKHLLCSQCKTTQESDKPCIICGSKISQILTVSLIKFTEVSKQFKNEPIKEEMI
jgi:hypothetical protein